MKNNLGQNEIGFGDEPCQKRIQFEIRVLFDFLFSFFVEREVS